MLSTWKQLFLTCAKPPHSKCKLRTVNGALQQTHCGCSSPSSKYECVTRRGDVKDVNYDADGAYEGQYGCKQGPIWVYVMADMGTLEWSLWVWKHKQYLLG